ncbi:MAG: hypothetical protein LBO68_02650 [Synergistaceae bacterium]|jgi:hypothetical protein|nr:hypothetical protein [Synergistaceae bacterium]
MSVTVVAVGSSLALLHALILAAGVAGAAFGVGKNVMQNKLHRIEETRDALKKKMLDDISAELGRMGSESQEGLRKELENLKGSLDLQLDDPAYSASLEELNALKGKIRAVEVDEKQCRRRSEAVRRLFDSIRALGVASYSEELERLEGEFEKISTLSPGERLLELQGMAEQLQEMEKLAAAASELDIETLREHRYVFEANAHLVEGKNEGKNEAQNMVREIRDWADRVAQLDESEGEKLRPLLENLKADTAFPDRLVRLHRQMKTAWGALRERTASTEFFRDKLGELLNLLQASQDALLSPEGSELSRRCHTLRGGKFIDRELFMTLYEDVARFVWSRGEEIADAVFARRVERTLAEMGYDLLPASRLQASRLQENRESEEPETENILRPEQVRYLESPYEGYRVMLKVDAKGGMTARLVRAVATEEEKEKEQNAPDANQVQKDREAGEKWCRDFDGFLAKMREQDLSLDVSLRQEPEESQVLVVVDESLGKNLRKREKKRRENRGTQALQEQTFGGGGGAV